MNLDFFTVNTLSRFLSVSCLHFCRFLFTNLLNFFLGSLDTWLRSKKHGSLVENGTSQEIGKKMTAYLALSKFVFAKWKHTE